MRMLRYIVVTGVACGVLACAARAEAPATIPEAFQGRWTENAEYCGNQSEDTTEVRVTGTTLRHYDGQAVVKSVSVLGADSVDVVATWDAEGRHFEATNRLILSNGGEILTITGIGKTGPSRFVRC